MLLPTNFCSESIISFDSLSHHSTSTQENGEFSDRSACHLSTVSIVGDQVRAAGTSIGDKPASGESLNTRNNSSRGGQALKSDQVSSKSSNVWSGHGGAGDGVGSASAADPRAEHVNTWGKDVEHGAKVTERGTGIVLVNGSNGDG